MYAWNIVVITGLVLLVPIWNCWAGAPSCYLELFDKPQKRICRTIGPSLDASLEPLAHRGIVASVSLFYRYYFGSHSLVVSDLCSKTKGS